MQQGTALTTSSTCQPEEEAAAGSRDSSPGSKTASHADADAPNVMADDGADEGSGASTGHEVSDHALTPGTPSPVKDHNHAGAGQVSSAHHISPVNLLMRMGLLRGSSASDASERGTAPAAAATSEQPEMEPACLTSKRPSRNSRRAHRKVPKPEGSRQNAQDCIACWSAARTVIFQPCGHFCCCATCADPVLNDGVPCPMCRGLVSACIDMDGSQ